MLCIAWYDNTNPPTGYEKNCDFNQYLGNDTRYDHSRRPCSDFMDMLWRLIRCRIIIIIIIIVTMECEYETVPKLLNGTIFNDPEWSVTHILRLRYYSTLNNLKMVQDWAIYLQRPTDSYMIYRTAPFWCTRMTPNTVFKVMPFIDAAYIRNS